MKKCPYCAEEIQDAAVVCRFCQKPQPPLRPARSPEYLAAQKATNRKLLIGLLFVLGLFGVSAIVGVLTSDSRRPASSDPARPTTIINLIGTEKNATPEELIARFGRPTEDSSSEDERPKPPIVTRILTYSDARVRAIYRADVPFGATRTSYEGTWRLVGFTDPVSNTKIDNRVVVERLKDRTRR